MKWYWMARLIVAMKQALSARCRLRFAVWAKVPIAALLTEAAEVSFASVARVKRWHQMATCSKQLSFVAEPLPSLTELRFVLAIRMEVRRRSPELNIAFLRLAEGMQMAAAVDWQPLEQQAPEYELLVEAAVLAEPWFATRWEAMPLMFEWDGLSVRLWGLKDFDRARQCLLP